MKRRSPGKKGKKPPSSASIEKIKLTFDRAKKIVAGTINPQNPAEKRVARAILKREKAHTARIVGKIPLVKVNEGGIRAYAKIPTPGQVLRVGKKKFITRMALHAKPFKGTVDGGHKASFARGSQPVNVIVEFTPQQIQQGDRRQYRLPVFHAQTVKGTRLVNFVGPGKAYLMGELWSNPQVKKVAGVPKSKKPERKLASGEAKFFPPLGTEKRKKKGKKAK